MGIVIILFKTISSSKFINLATYGCLKPYSTVILYSGLKIKHFLKKSNPSNVINEFTFTRTWKSGIKRFFFCQIYAVDNIDCLFAFYRI